LWKDIEFYGFLREGKCFNIRANVKIKWSKGQTRDESKYKIIPFVGLLPVEMALQDTLRLLLNLALMDGVFSDAIKAWKALYSIRLPADCAETGRRLPINPKMRKVPVLRRTRQHRITDDPVQTVDLRP
jgi:hypothetical protein